MQNQTLTKEQLAAVRKALLDFEDRTVDILNITPREIELRVSGLSQASVSLDPQLITHQAPDGPGAIMVRTRPDSPEKAHQ